MSKLHSWINSKFCIHVSGLSKLPCNKYSQDSVTSQNKCFTHTGSPVVVERKVSRMSQNRLVETSSLISFLWLRERGRNMVNCVLVFKTSLEQRFKWFISLPTWKHMEIPIFKGALEGRHKSKLYQEGKLDIYDTEFCSMYSNLRFLSHILW